MQIIKGEHSFYTSVAKALEEIDSMWEILPGLLIVGSHAPAELDVDSALNQIRRAREQGIPTLAICLGHQLAAIEYARNVLGIKDATSEEFSASGTHVVKKLPELNVGIREVDGRMESFWNHYEVDLPEWEKPSHFFTCQYHPEYQSSKEDPHPLLVQFIELCKKNT